MLGKHFSFKHKRRWFATDNFLCIYIFYLKHFVVSAYWSKGSDFFTLFQNEPVWFAKPKKQRTEMNSNFFFSTSFSHLHISLFHMVLK